MWNRLRPLQVCQFLNQNSLNWLSYHISSSN
jgi:hypothetical protein